MSRCLAHARSVRTARLLGFLQFFGKRGHDFEDVSDYTVVGNFENRRILILVNRDDGARALHADNVLDGAADAKRQIKLRSDSLARAADLALHGEPAFVANRA